MFHSNNPDFEPYEVKASLILETCNYACGFSITEYSPDDIKHDTVKAMLHELKKDVSFIKTKLL